MAIEGSEAGRALRAIPSDERTQASVNNAAKGRAALEADPEKARRRSEAVSAAQKARWEKYREEKAKESAQRQAEG